MGQTRERFWHIDLLSLPTTGRRYFGGSNDFPHTIMKYKNNKSKKQSPHEIKKQILEQLKRERDPIEREMLQQRLHHYNTITNKNQ